MTLLMLRVADAREAAVAADAGFDAAEFVLDAAAPSALEAARAIRAAFPGLLRLRIDGSRVTPVLQAVEALGAVEIATDLDAVLRPGLADAAPPVGVRRVGLLADARNGLTAIQRTRGRIDALMIEPPAPARLIDTSGIAELDAFASACRDAGIAFGFGGGLEAPDVARLLLLEPDVLAFDAAVRREHAVDAALDPDALAALRALVSRADGGPRRAPAKVAKVTDCVFVRDFEISLAIGAYRAEHGSRQRVRFSVEAEVVREPVPPRDMRDVFSYDVIIETIRVLSERPHVTFVETLAEEVAAALLTHAEVGAVSVKVEKLDIVPGAVGIEIRRRRIAP